MVDLDRFKFLPARGGSPYELGLTIEAFIDARIDFHLSQRGRSQPVLVHTESVDDAATTFVNSIDALIQIRLEQAGLLPTVLKPEAVVDNSSDRYKTTIEDVTESKAGYTTVPSDNKSTTAEKGESNVPPNSDLADKEVYPKQPTTSMDRINDMLREISKNMPDKPKVDAKSAINRSTFGCKSASEETTAGSDVGEGANNVNGNGYGYGSYGTSNPTRPSYAPSNPVPPANPTTSASYAGQGVNINVRPSAVFDNPVPNDPVHSFHPSIPVPPAPSQSLFEPWDSGLGNNGFKQFACENRIPPGGLFGNGGNHHNNTQSLFGTTNNGPGGTSAGTNHQVNGTDNQTSSFGEQITRPIDIAALFGKPSSVAPSSSANQTSSLFGEQITRPIDIAALFGKPSSLARASSANPTSNSTGLFGSSNSTPPVPTLGVPSNRSGLFGPANPSSAVSNTGNPTNEGAFRLFGSNPTPVQPVTGKSTNRLFPDGEWRPPILQRIETTLNRVETQVSTVDAMKGNLKAICEHIGMPVPEGLEDVSK